MAVSKAALLAPERLWLILLSASAGRVSPGGLGDPFAKPPVARLATDTWHSMTPNRFNARIYGAGNGGRWPHGHPAVSQGVTALDAHEDT